MNAMYYVKSITSTFLTVLLLILCGCASTGSSSHKSVATDTETMTLEDHLRRINGVRIVGTGQAAKVFVGGTRGVSSVSRGMGTPESKKDLNLSDSDDRQPLFVVDGQKVGRNYPDVRDMFSRGEIKSVKLLSDAEAAQYGGQSGNGVIVITTNSASDNDNGSE